MVLHDRCPVRYECHAVVVRLEGDGPIVGESIGRRDGTSCDCCDTTHGRRLGGTRLGAAARGEPKIAAATQRGQAHAFGVSPRRPRPWTSPGRWSPPRVRSMRSPWRFVRDPWLRRRKDIAKEVPALASGLGGSGAAMAGVALLGPPGALIGAAASVGGRKVLEALGVGRVFDSAAERIAERHLDQNERERVTAAYTAALKGIAEQADAGLRNDGFFDQPRADDGRTNAEEVLENVLRRAEQAYEHRKAERLGELFAYIARHNDVTPAHANRLITLVGRLTFRQLLWLGFFTSTKEQDPPDWSSSGTLGVRDQGFVLEVLELAQLGCSCAQTTEKLRRSLT